MRHPAACSSRGECSEQVASELPAEILAHARKIAAFLPCLTVLGPRRCCSEWRLQLFSIDWSIQKVRLLENCVSRDIRLHTGPSHAATRYFAGSGPLLLAPSSLLLASSELTPQRHNRVQVCGLPCGIHTKEHAHSQRHSKPGEHAPQRDIRWKGQ